MRIEVKVALPLACTLGEGLHWDERRNLLWFVDINGPHVYWFNLDSGELGRRAMPEPVGWVLSVENSERVLVGLKSGIGLFDVFDEPAQIEWVDRRFPADPDHRLNDAKVDQHGRLWYGSVSASDESQAVACLARYDWNGAGPVIIDSGYRVTNGPAFDHDGGVMLHSDSARRITYKYDIEVATGVASNRAVWKRFAEDEGYPDGMSFDSEDCVWIAHWNAARVCRYDVNGNLLLAIGMPALNVTNVCFAGKNLNRMFVTSAREGLAQGQDSSTAGALFEITGLNVIGAPPGQLRI